MLRDGTFYEPQPPPGLTKPIGAPSRQEGHHTQGDFIYRLERRDWDTWRFTTTRARRSRLKTSTSSRARPPISPPARTNFPLSRFRLTSPRWSPRGPQPDTHCCCCHVRSGSTPPTAGAPAPSGTRTSSPQHRPKNSSYRSQTSDRTESADSGRRPTRAPRQSHRGRLEGRVQYRGRRPHPWGRHVRGPPGSSRTLAGGVARRSPPRWPCQQGSTTAPAPRDAGAGAASVSGYGLTQPIEPTGRLLPVDVAVNPKVTLPSGGMDRL